MSTRRWRRSAVQQREMYRPSARCPPERFQSSSHFARRFARKGNSQNISGIGTTSGDAIRNSIGEHSCLADPSRVNDRCRRRTRDRITLFGVKAIQELPGIHKHTIGVGCTGANIAARYDTTMAFSRKSLNPDEELILDLNPLVALRCSNLWDGLGNGSGHMFV